MAEQRGLRSGAVNVWRVWRRACAASAGGVPLTDLCGWMALCLCGCPVCDVPPGVQLLFISSSSFPPLPSLSDLISSPLPANLHPRTELCHFSGGKIFPGHGRMFARLDGASQTSPPLPFRKPRFFRNSPSPLPLSLLDHQPSGRVFIFLNSKSESLFKQRKNPRKIAWTVLYRRKHKKGLNEESSKRRTRRNVKYQRAIGDMKMEDILKKRQEKPDFRKHQREQLARWVSLPLRF